MPHVRPIATQLATCTVRPINAIRQDREINHGSRKGVVIRFGVGGPMNNDSSPQVLFAFNIAVESREVKLSWIYRLQTASPAEVFRPLQWARYTVNNMSLWYRDKLHGKIWVVVPTPSPSGVQRGVGWGGCGVQTPPSPKIRRPAKIVPNSTRLWKLLKIAEFRTPTLQDIRLKKGSKILKTTAGSQLFYISNDK